MLVKDFIYVSSLNTGSTTFESDIIKYFKINTNQTLEKVAEDLDKIIKIENKVLKNRYIFFNKKLWKICIPLEYETFDQWARMENILAEGNNNKNITIN